MSLEQMVLVLAFLFSLGYMILGLLAYSNKSDNKNADSGWMLSSVWVFFPEAYNEKGKKLCRSGRILFWLATICMVVRVILKHNNRDSLFWF
jgi:hypothetical protein